MRSSTEVSGARQVRTRRLIVAAACAILILHFVVGCRSGPSGPSSSVPAIIPSSSMTQNKPGPTVSRWPAGVAAVLLARTGGFSVITRDGTLVEELHSVPATTITAVGPSTSSPAYETVLSGNQKLLGYAFAGEDLLVRSLLDGTILKRARFELSGDLGLRALSDDGRYFALAPSHGSAVGDPTDRTPWALSVLDLGQGRQSVARSLWLIVKERLNSGSSESCGLVGAWWLPRDKLLINLSGSRYQTFIYDPATDLLESVPGLERVFSVCSGGIILGVNDSLGTTLVWHDGQTETVVPDPAWPLLGAGTIAPDGGSLVLWVGQAGPSGGVAKHGWQRFIRKGTEWQAASSVAEMTWMNHPPSRTNAGGSIAWVALEASKQGVSASLVSLDFLSNTWQVWLSPGDLPPDFSPFRVVDIVLLD